MIRYLDNITIQTSNGRFLCQHIIIKCKLFEIVQNIFLFAILTLYHLKITKRESAFRYSNFNLRGKALQLVYRKCRGDKSNNLLGFSWDATPGLDECQRLDFLNHHTIQLWKGNVQPEALWVVQQNLKMCLSYTFCIWNYFTHWYLEVPQRPCWYFGRHFLNHMHLHMKTLSSGPRRN